MCDWEGCTTGTIGLLNPNRRSVVKTSGFLHPYTYGIPPGLSGQILGVRGEGMTWMRQPSWQGIALFSVRMEFWRSTGSQIFRPCPTGSGRSETGGRNTTSVLAVGALIRSDQRYERELSWISFCIFRSTAVLTLCIEFPTITKY